MTWRRRLRRRLLWAGVLLGLVLLLVAVSVLRFCAWGRDLVTDNASRSGRAFERKEGTMPPRTLTLVVGIAVAALAIAPTALGKGRLAPLSPPPSQVATYRDAGDATTARASLLHLAGATGTLDVAAISKAVATDRDAGDATTARVSLLHLVGATGTLNGGHTDNGWSQIAIGIAIGIGMALAIGLGFAVQTKRARPLPH